MYLKKVKLAAGILPIFMAALLLTVLFFGCKKSGAGSPATQPASNPLFAKGADISWLTQMEASGYKFYKSAGAALECIQLMKNLGINSIRLRVWGNPAGGWEKNAALVSKAGRAKKLG